MSNAGMQRRQIEDNIHALAHSLNTQDARWHEGQAFAEYVSAWRHLVRYYEWSHDTSIDAHLLKLYMRHAVLLRRIIEDDRASQRRRQQAKAALKDINAQLDAIFRCIERNGGSRAAV